MKKKKLKLQRGYWIALNAASANITIINICLLMAKEICYLQFKCVIAVLLGTYIVSLVIEDAVNEYYQYKKTQQKVQVR